MCARRRRPPRVETPATSASDENWSCLRTPRRSKRRRSTARESALAPRTARSPRRLRVGSGTRPPCTASTPTPMPETSSTPPDARAPPLKTFRANPGPSGCVRAGRPGRRRHRRFRGARRPLARGRRETAVHALLLCSHDPGSSRGRVAAAGAPSLRGRFLRAAQYDGVSTPRTPWSWHLLQVHAAALPRAAQQASSAPAS